MSFNFFGDVLDESSVNINNVIVSGPKGVKAEWYAKQSASPSGMAQAAANIGASTSMQGAKHMRREP